MGGGGAYTAPLVAGIETLCACQVTVYTSREMYRGIVGIVERQD